MDDPAGDGGAPGAVAAPDLSGTPAVGARLAALPPLREVIAAAGLTARRSLGQNFLLDLNLTGRIARAAGDLSTGTTIEIGPGPGGLTRALLAAGATRLVAIERDDRAVAALQPVVTAAAGRLALHAEDALAVDPVTLGPAPRHIVANLPYNISTRLVVQWLETVAAEPTALAAMVLMFQKEVALRLTAEPGSGDYGRLAVLTGWLCTAERLFDIPPRAFTPPPRVTSTVVRLTPRPAPLHPAPLPALQRVVAAAFGQRRKMLRTSLKPLVRDPVALLTAADIDPTRRAETVDRAGFCALARALAAGDGR